MTEVKSRTSYLNCINLLLYKSNMLKRTTLITRITLNFVIFIGVREKCQYGHNFEDVDGCSDFNFFENEEGSDSGESDEAEKLGTGHDGRAFAFPERDIYFADLFQGPVGELLELIKDGPGEIEVDFETGRLLCLFDIGVDKVAHFNEIILF
jgi:hypothetical protein